jgi:membrane associated rhomboid family serine protease
MLPRPEIDFQRTPVTLLITALVVAIEVVCTLDPARREYFYMTLQLGLLSAVWSGEFWRPFTTTLLHGNLVHAAFNVYWTLAFGRVLEPYLGSLRYFGLFVLLGYVSSMLTFLINNLDAPLDGQVGVVGLSGIIYGLFGLLWIGRRWRHDFAAVCNADTVKLFVAWFFFCIFLTYAGVMNVSNLAHGTGLAFGALYGLALFQPRRRFWWAVLAGLLSLAVLATMIASPGHRLYEQHRHILRISLN